MSIVVCSSCAAPIDTDEDVEAYRLTGPDGREIKLDEPLCPRCRAEAEEKLAE